MNLKFITYWLSLAIYLLLITQFLGDGFVQGHDHSSTHHMDQSTQVFFTLDGLKLGKVMPIFFRGTKSSTAPQFLPREEADLIPFSISKLDFLLDYFGFSRGSSQAKAMEDTLRECVAKPIKGETKFCATSLESMLDFVHDMIGVTVQVRVLTTRKLEKSSNAGYDNVLQNYTIVDEPREAFAPKMVACHTMPYPYVIYYCHYQKSESKVFQVSLRGENDKNKNRGVGVEAVAVCHMDTSQWSINHVSFKHLGIKPGTLPVCHFFPADNLVWVPLPSTKIEDGRVSMI